MLNIRCTVNKLIDLLCPESSGMVGKAESAVSSLRHFHQLHSYAGYPQQQEPLSSLASTHAPCPRGWKTPGTLPGRPCSPCIPRHPALLRKVRRPKGSIIDKITTRIISCHTNATNWTKPSTTTQYAAPKPLYGPTLPLPLPPDPAAPAAAAAAAAAPAAPFLSSPPSAPAAAAAASNLTGPFA